MAKSKYLYQSLLFSSINSNYFCGCLNNKNKKEQKPQTTEQTQPQTPVQTPVQDQNQQEDKRKKLIDDCNELINKIKKLDPNYGKTVEGKDTVEKLTNFKTELENDLDALEKKKKEEKPNQKPEETKEKNYINIIKTLKKTYNDVIYCDLKNNCCIYYCRFNKKEDPTEKIDDKGNKVEKHFVYIYVSYLDNYKLIAKTKNDTSDKEKLKDDILKNDELAFVFLGLKSFEFKLEDFKSILFEFINLCDSEGNLINKIKEPLITISLKVYYNSGETKKYKLWLGLINNNLYYETKSTKGKRLLIPMKVLNYERLKAGTCEFTDIYAYSNDDKEKQKIYFYRLENTHNYDMYNKTFINIKGAPSDDFKIEGNNIEDICEKNKYSIEIDII